MSPYNNLFFFFFGLKEALIITYNNLISLSWNKHKSNAIVTNSFRTFLQIVDVVNSYWFSSKPTIKITFFIYQ